MDERAHPRVGEDHRVDLSPLEHLVGYRVLVGRAYVPTCGCGRHFAVYALHEFVPGNARACPALALVCPACLRLSCLPLLYPAPPVRRLPLDSEDRAALEEAGFLPRAGDPFADAPAVRMPEEIRRRMDALFGRMKMAEEAG